MRFSTLYSFLLSAALFSCTTHAQQWKFDAPVDFDALAQAMPSELPAFDDPAAGGGYAPMSTPTPQVGLNGNAADAIFPEIENLADSLGNDPARIVEFVYNSINY